MHSHISDVIIGRMQYVLEVTSEQCTKMHQMSMIKIGFNTDIVGLQVNATNLRAVMLAGSVGVDGSCSGTQYSDSYGTWDQVTVHVSIKIMLKEYFARVHLNKNKISLYSGISCTLLKNFCLDIGRNTFWRHVPINNCHFDKYKILYERMGKNLSIQIPFFLQFLVLFQMTFEICAD